MRISDWSSDVCSSDLDDRRAVSAPDKKLTGYASSGRDVDEGFTSNAHRLQGPQARQADRDRQRPELIQAAFAVLSNHACINVRKQVSVRSDEHTSDLQSLMRISYAAFCLKKKKKNNTKN